MKRILAVVAMAALMWAALAGMSEDPTRTVDRYQTAQGPPVDISTDIPQHAPIAGFEGAAEAAFYAVIGDNGCVATAMHHNRNLVAVSARHCAIRDEAMRPAHADGIRFAFGGSRGDHDMAFWVPTGEASRQWLAERAVPFPPPDTQTAQGERVICLAYKAVSRGVIPVTMSGMLGSEVNMMKLSEAFVRWSSVQVMDQSTWPGSSGSPCFNRRAQPVAMVVGGMGIQLSGARIPQPPSLAESLSAFADLREEVGN